MIVTFLHQYFSPEAATFILGMLPITELRLAIPLAIGVYKMSVLSAFFWATAGNVFIGVAVILFIDLVYKIASSRIPAAKKMFDWWFSRVNKKIGENHEKYGAIALTIFVAIPLPVTGAWSGAAAAFLLGIPKKRAIFFVSLGVVIAGIIVSLLSAGAFSFLG